MYVNIFQSRRRIDIDGDAYAVDAEWIAVLAREQKGFVFYRSYRSQDGEAVSISGWESEADARAWARHPDHAAVQARGQADYYDSYTNFSCADVEIRRFERKA